MRPFISIERGSDLHDDGEIWQVLSSLLLYRFIMGCGASQPTTSLKIDQKQESINEYSSLPFNMASGEIYKLLCQYL